MKFSIITPTLQRESLRKTCDSVDAQTHTDWEHIVMVDCEELKDISFDIEHPCRKVVQCLHPHKNYGNTCRNTGWKFASGDYVIYLDDDNFLPDVNILSDISDALIYYADHDREKLPPWCLFPILRHGSIFFTDPPRSCHVDTANILVKREYAQWPDGPEYTMDGIFCERLVKEYPDHAAFPDFRPIIVMPTSNEGR